MYYRYFGFNKPIPLRRGEVSKMISITIEIHDEEDAENVVNILRKINEMTEELYEDE